MSAIALLLVALVGADSRGKLVYEFTGNGPGTTKEFKIQPDWTLDWKSKDEPTEDTRMVEVALPDHKVGGYILHKRGQAWDKHFTEGGRVKITVKYPYGGGGPWRIRIYQGSGKID